MKINFNHSLRTHNPTSAGIILPSVFNITNPKSVLDVGCGNGSWLKICSDLEVKETFGVDGIQIPDNELLIKADEFLKYDLTKELVLKRKFDMVISLEVAEHLPESAADTFVDNLVRHGDVILFSAAIPGQGGQHHINEQWPEYWHLKFKKRGFYGYDFLRTNFWNNDDIQWWYQQNILLFAKKGHPAFKDREADDIINALIHPKLYNKKIFKPKFLNSRKDIFKQLMLTLKWLLKNK
jgi:SAM-dependent methyltransferase